MTFTSTPITVKDSAATDKSIIAYNDGTSSAFAHPILDNTGAIISPATAGNQATANTSLAAIASSVATIATAASGEATAAKQDTGNTSLATIATNTTGVATGAKQDTGNTALAAIQTNTTGVATAANQATANTSLASIATNTTGVATAAKQDTGNTSLAAIATSVATIATAAGGEATAALQTTGNTSLGSLVTNTGAQADTAATTDTGTFSLIALFKRSLQTLTSILTACQAATPAGTNKIGNVGVSGTTVVANNTITRPANTTAYAFAQMLANSTTAASCTAANSAFAIDAAPANDADFYLTGILLGKTSTNATQPIFRVHFFNVDPFASAPAGGDGAAINLASRTGYLGSMETSMDATCGNGMEGQGASTRQGFLKCKPATGTKRIYGVIEVRGAYVPATTEVFDLTQGDCATMGSLRRCWHGDSAGQGEGADRWGAT